jgi:hypothetical protein
MRFDQGHALIIGVGADLPSTIDDAQGLADILKDEERCAYPAEQVRLLTGPAADRGAVLSALDTLAQRTDTDSTVVVYFSGHGYQVSTAVDDTYFLMPHGYDVNRLKATAIEGAEFTAKLRSLPARRLLMLLDCCHAGGVGEAKAPHVDALTKAPLPPEAVELLAEGSGRVLIASSREDELSFAGKPYSAFTLALVEALSGVGVAKEDGVVRVADVALHARQVVPGRTGNRQHPILHFERADNFVLAYYAGGAKEPKGLPFDVEPEIEPQPGAWRGTALDQRGQRVHGPQTNIAGDVQGPVLSGQFDGPVAVGNGEAVDMRGSRGALYKPAGPIEQQFGDRITITGDGNVVGDHSRSTVVKHSKTGVTIDEFLQVLDKLQQGLSTVELDPDLAEAVEADVQTAQTQAQKPEPNRSLLLMRLGNVAQMLATIDGVWGVSERLLPLAQQALDWGQQLFG